MSKNESTETKKKSESPEEKMEKLKEEILSECRDIAEGNQLSCFNLVVKTKALMQIEELHEIKKK